MSVNLLLLNCANKLMVSVSITEPGKIFRLTIPGTHATPEVAAKIVTSLQLSDDNKKTLLKRFPYHILNMSQTPSNLANFLPGKGVTVKHPVSGVHMELHTVIISLNDGARWTREQIADWLETLDVDLTISDVPESNIDYIKDLANKYEFEWTSTYEQ